MVEEISDSISDTLPEVQLAMDQFPDFKDLGKRILLAWAEGVEGLRDNRMYSVGPWKSMENIRRLSDPPKLLNPNPKIGRSEGLGKR
jgi:serine/threonine-protein kinase HipA